jgi:hypothetical protein
MTHPVPRFLLACLCASLIAATPASAQSPVERVRGDVVAFDGQNLKLTTSAGQPLTVKLGSNYTVSARSRADLGSIVNGAFLGTTAVPMPDGTLTALEVHVFPESMRGTGEGHRSMDVMPGSTMTNATVTAVQPAVRAAPASTMTNATVANVAQADQGRKMTLKYPGGEKTIVVPKETPVVMVEPGDKSLLVAGAHVVLSATRQADGTLTADRVTVGKDGLVPPM